ncbi:hypothetical protein ACFQPA_10650 [Halomarina halobia]|uniref:PGF-CTERM sorting domain-containing protein n=1 Tax=Halomarina halobia TaxID=3033386 RepID=A0ABD6AA76_9EURY|nr:hypothetical protein [Halomarina sp. PSR21]
MTDDGTFLSRRALLAGVGATALSAAPAGAQENGSGDGTNGSGYDGGVDDNITTPAILPERPIGENTDYRGVFVHLTSELEDVQVDGIQQCDVTGWDPGNTDVFEVTLINRQGDADRTYASSMYFPREVDLTPGYLFVINNQEPCPNGYLGVEVTEVRAEANRRGFAGSPEAGASGGTSGASGPGFGPVGALGGIAAVGYALARRAGDE